MAPKAKSKKTASKKKTQPSGDNEASTSQPQTIIPRRRDGRDPNDPVRIYADGKLDIITEW
jgi:hypothetical protein